MKDDSYRNKQTNICKECATAGLNCQDRQKCAPVRTGTFRSYNGIRLTADGFDCALPVTIDSHSSCAYECLYCFSDNIIGHSNMSKALGRTSLAMLEGIFAGRETLMAQSSARHCVTTAATPQASRALCNLAAFVTLVTALNRIAAGCLNSCALHKSTTSPCA